MENPQEIIYKREAQYKGFAALLSGALAIALTAGVFMLGGSFANSSSLVWKGVFGLLALANANDAYKNFQEYRDADRKLTLLRAGGKEPELSRSQQLELGESMEQARSRPDGQKWVDVIRQLNSQEVTR